MQQVKIQNVSDNEFQNNEEKQKDTSHKKNSSIKFWGNLQKVRYMMFLINNKQCLEDENLTNKMYWYEKMSYFVYDQWNSNCMKHHSIYLEKFKSIEKIIDYLKGSIYFDKQMLQEEIIRLNKIQKVFQQKMIKSLDTLRPKQQSNIILKATSIEIVKGSNILRNRLEEQLKKFQVQKVVQKEQLIIKVPLNICLVVQKRVLTSKNQAYKCQSEKANQIINNFKNEQSLFDHKMRRIKRKSKKTSKVQKKKIIKKKIQQMRNHLPFKAQQEYLETIKIQEKNPQSYSKKKKVNYWTRIQKIKALIYLYITKGLFKVYDKKKFHELYKKFSQYIDTDKTSKDCRKHFFYLRKKYDYSLQKMIKKEIIKYDIFPELIQIEFRKMINLSQNLDNQLTKIFTLQIELKKLKQELKMDNLLTQKLSLNFQIQFSSFPSKIDLQTTENLNLSMRQQANLKTDHDGISQNQKREQNKIDEPNDHQEIKIIIKVQVQANNYKYFRNNTQQNILNGSFFCIYKFLKISND